MKIDVRKCNAEKEYAGNLSFAFEGDGALIDIPYASFSGPIQAELRYEIGEDDKVEVRGRIRFSLKGLCSRCLNETVQSYEGEVDAVYSPSPEEDEYGYRGVIDLTELLRDSLLEAMPLSLLCSDTCEPPAYKE